MSSLKRHLHRRLGTVAILLGLLPLAFESRSMADGSEKQAPKRGGPGYVEIVASLESQPVQGAQLLFWDQSLSDTLGIKLPPGRVGLPEFEQAVLAKVAREIKASAQSKSGAASNNRTVNGDPVIFVENDAHGGSGRAGYIEVESDVWVNIKGIGITGQGNTHGTEANPPADKFRSHSDGSATLEEAIKEAVLSKTMDAEMRRGAGRVLGIVYTGRTITYKDGRKVPLALIIRAPLKRWDQSDGGKVAAVADSLAQANASRFMKGDVVNKSNIGASGEFVDFGCTTHTCGYSNARSSQNEGMFFEGNLILGETTAQSAYVDKIGENLLMQLGIPEQQVLGIKRAGQGSVQGVTSALREIVNVQEPVLLDFENVPKEKAEGDLKLHLWFRDLVANYLSASPDQRGAFAARESRRLFELSGKQPDEKSGKAVRTFLRELEPMLSKLADSVPAGKTPEFAESIRKVATFKNRDIWGLVRPWLFPKAGSVADEFVRNHNARAVQDFIENTVLDNRVGTVPGADSEMSIRADSRNTEIFIRRFDGKDGVSRLFEYPDMTGAEQGEEFWFRVSTDGWKSSKNLKAAKVTTALGDYFKITIPHGSMPVTDARVELSPFIKGASGSERWLRANFNLRGPPVLINERLGLPPAFVRRTDGMRAEYGVRIRPLPQDLDEIRGTASAGPKFSKAEFDLLTRELSDNDLAVWLGAAAELRSDPKLSGFVTAVINDGKRPYRVDAQRAAAAQAIDAIRASGYELPTTTDLDILLLHGRLAAPDVLRAGNRAQTVDLVVRALRGGADPIALHFIENHREAFVNDAGFGRFLGELANGGHAQLALLPLIKDERAIVALNARYTKGGEDWSDRFEVLQKLRNAAVSENTKRLFSTLLHRMVSEDPHPAVRFQAAGELLRLEKDRALPFLIGRSAIETDPEAKARITKLFYENPPKTGVGKKLVSDFYHGLLDSKSTADRLVALGWLAWFERPASLPLLVARFSIEEDPAIREAILSSVRGFKLGWFGDSMRKDQLKDLVQRGLRDAEPRVRRAAITNALAGKPDEVATHFLERLNGLDFEKDEGLREVLLGHLALLKPRNRNVAQAANAYLASASRPNLIKAPQAGVAQVVPVAAAGTPGGAAGCLKNVIKQLIYR